MPLQAFLPPHALPARSWNLPATSARRQRRALPKAVTRDWYKVLEIPPDAPQPSIKRAYRRAALKNHPDVSKAPDAKERFQRVQEAYSVLSDPSKRATYDRRSRASASGFGDSSAWTGGAGGSGFDARRWREGNPMPQDLNDSFGSIFSDIFSGVADAVEKGKEGGGGIMDDFVEFLEKQVDGFGVNDSGYASDEDDGLESILKSSDPDVLQAEIDDARFVMEQLRSRRTKLEAEEEGLLKRAAEWGVRADRAERGRDYMTRDAARERERDLNEEAKRFSTRARKTQSHIEKQQRRLKRIEKRLDQVKKESKQTDVASTRVETKASQKQAIDEELNRMKRELGL